MRSRIRRSCCRICRLAAGRCLLGWRLTKVWKFFYFFIFLSFCLLACYFCNRRFSFVLVFIFILNFILTVIFFVSFPFILLNWLIDWLADWLGFFSSSFFLLCHSRVLEYSCSRDMRERVSEKWVKAGKKERKKEGKKGNQQQLLRKRTKSHPKYYTPHPLSISILYNK